jgi:hypothetical protein
VLDRPVAADFDRDGIDDIGLWVPRDNAQVPTAAAEWYILISNNFIAAGVPGPATTGTIARLNHPFTPVPFGFDLYAEFGNETALPLVGNFDPPVADGINPHTTNPSADFDGDQDVDGADLLTWQRGLGQPNATASAGDANGDGLVNAGDRDVWVNQFGQAPAELAASSVGGEVVSVAAGISAAAISAPAADKRADFNQLYVVATPSTAHVRTLRRESAADAVFAGTDPRWGRSHTDEHRDGAFGAIGSRRRGSLRINWDLFDAPAFKGDGELASTAEEWDEAVTAAI